MNRPEQPKLRADETIRRELINYLNGLADQVEPSQEILERARDIPQKYPLVKQIIKRKNPVQSSEEPGYLLRKALAAILEKIEILQIEKNLDFEAEGGLRRAFELWMFSRRERLLQICRSNLQTPSSDEHIADKSLLFALDSPRLLLRGNEFELLEAFNNDERSSEILSHDSSKYLVKSITYQNTGIFTKDHILKLLLIYRYDEERYTSSKLSENSITIQDRQILERLLVSLSNLESRLFEIKLAQP